MLIFIKILFSFIPKHIKEFTIRQRFHNLPEDQLNIEGLGYILTSVHTFGNSLINIPREDPDDQWPANPPRNLGTWNRNVLEFVLQVCRKIISATIVHV